MINKTIAICHYRIGKTDGVSLEIIKRKKVLEKMGYKVVLISGPIEQDTDHIIPLLEFDRPDVLKIRHNAFEKFEDFKTDKEFEKYIDKIAEKIKNDFLKIHKKENFDYLFIHNIFTHGRHIASAKAFCEIAQETKIKVISVNHDFYWVGAYRDVYKPTTPFVNEYLKRYSPPLLPQITHVAINSINRKALIDKIHQDAILLPDTFDFSQKPWVRDEYNSDLPGKIGVNESDLMILQATRISRRKGIEIAIDFAAQLSKNINKLSGIKLYNGKTLNGSSKIILAFAGYAEKDSLDYKNALIKLLKQKNVNGVFISDMVGAERGIINGSKIYSLWDCYVFADIVTYPSFWEGWGNQLIEAVFARKPVALFEYPVFKKDIKKEGYKVISFGDKLSENKETILVRIPQPEMEKAVDQSVRMLTGKDTLQILDNNFRVGEKYHSDVFLRKKLTEILNKADKKVTHLPA